LIEHLAVAQHMRRGVHVRAGVGAHRQQRFAEAVLLEGV